MEFTKGSLESSVPILHLTEQITSVEKACGNIKIISGHLVLQTLPRVQRATSRLTSSALYPYF